MHIREDTNIRDTACNSLFFFVAALMGQKLEVSKICEQRLVSDMLWAGLEESDKLWEELEAIDGVKDE